MFRIFGTAVLLVVFVVVACYVLNQLSDAESRFHRRKCRPLDRSVDPE